MNCDRAMERILSADADGRLSLSTRLHLLCCPQCAAEARRLRKALIFMKSAFLPAAPDLSGRILEVVSALEPRPAAPVSFKKWITVGMSIIAAMVLSPLGADYGWVQKSFGTGFLLPINLILGFILAVYCALFIGTHLREISHRFNLPRP